MTGQVRFEDFADMLVDETCRPVQEALAAATAGYWLRRADQFDDARPRTSDFPGAATPEQLAEQDLRLAATAQACRARAAVSDLDTVTPEERELITELMIGSAA